ncbi:MAG: helix-turn-helix domain-containing protein [Rhodospirillaceae bacterium]|nr:helix-turn-helix domain-containing protein [Rhodospirillaceae bacterium]
MTRKATALRQQSSLNEAQSSNRLPRILAKTYKTEEGTGIGILLIEGFDLFDLGVITDTLSVANSLLKEPRFKIHLTSYSEKVTASNGISIETEGRRALEDVSNIVVLAGDAVPRGEWFLLIAALRQKIATGARVIAIGSATRIVAESGLARQGKISTHLRHYHAWCELFGVQRVSDQLISFDEHVVTCIGMEASIDLSLLIVAQECGQDIAQSVATVFNVGHPYRMQSSYRRYPTSSLSVRNEKLKHAMQAFRYAADEKVTTKEIARRLNIGARQLQRLFMQHLGTTPNLYSLQCRLIRAQQLLQYTTITITETAVACGFVSVSHFAQRYRRQFGHRPTDEKRPI